MANENQKSFWCGQGGSNWVKKKETLDDMLGPFGNLAIKNLTINKNANIIDIGCGSGATTFQIAKNLSDNDSITGVDISKPLVSHAQTLNTFKNVTFIEDDIQTSNLTPNSFTHAFSRFGVMFFDDPVTAFKNIFNLLKPNGELSFICWQSPQKNLWQTLIMKEIKQIIDLPSQNPRDPGPFAFGEKEYIQSILDNTGFTGTNIVAYEQPVTIFKGYTPSEAVSEMLMLNPSLSFLKDYPDEKRKEIQSKLEKAYSAYQNKDGFEFPSSAWVVSAKKSI